MIGIDSNILMRFIVQDDPGQSAKVDALFAGLCRQDPGFLSLVTLAESVWVLKRIYRLQKPDLIRFVQTSLETDHLTLENPSAVTQALHKFAGSDSDFTDCLVERVNLHRGCSKTLTFEKRASKSAGMVLL